MATFRTSRPVSVADPSLPHLVLVGLPGAGKSAVGALIAAALGRTFLDFDVEISRREGMSVPEIFASRGEPHFRHLEQVLTTELRDFGNMVLAPGGGWMAREETVSLIRPAARIVYLKVTPATAMRRMGREAAGRPLLRHPQPLAELERLLSARSRSYESADVVIDAELLTAEQVARLVIEDAAGEQRV